MAELGRELSVRVNGLDLDHVAVLADVPGTLPPVIVHRDTMRVVDGAHRLEAARARGEDHVDVVFVDGDDFDILVTALRLNAGHGLPLSQQDRRAAWTASWRTGRTGRTGGSRPWRG